MCWRNVEWAGEVVYYCVYEILYAFVFEGGSAYNWHEAVSDCLATDSCFEGFDGNGFFLEIEHADFFIEVAHLSDEVIVGGLGFVLEIVWNFVNFVGGTHRVVIDIDDRFLVDDVDLSLEVILSTKWEKDRPCVGAEFGAHAF